MKHPNTSPELDYYVLTEKDLIALIQKASMTLSDGDSIKGFLQQEGIVPADINPVNLHALTDEQLRDYIVSVGSRVLPYVEELDLRGYETSVFSGYDFSRKISNKVAGRKIICTAKKELK